MELEKKAKVFVKKLCKKLLSEEKKTKQKRVESLFRVAVSDLPDALLSSELLDHADKYLDYFRRRLHLSQPGTTELQQQQELQDVAVDTGSLSVSPRLPYNLYWRRRKINKKTVGELGMDAGQMYSLYLSEVICQLGSIDEVAELLERCQATTSTSANEKADGSQDSCQQLLANIRKLGAIFSGCSEPLVLQRLLQICQSGLSDVALDSLDLKRLNDMKHSIVDFLTYCHVKPQSAKEFVKPSYGDLVAAILSVYVDVMALTSRGLSESEKSAAGKRLCSTVFYLLDGCRHLSLDVLIQCEQLHATDSAVIRPFCQRVLERPTNLDMLIYTKYLLAANVVSKLLPNDWSQLVSTVTQVSAPRHYSRWLRHRVPSIATKLPSLKHTKGSELTSLLLRAADSESVASLLLEVVTSGEDAESGVEETSSNTVSVCHESTPTKEPQTKRRKVEEDGDGSYLRQLPALTHSEDVVKFVVDRRPSKTLFTDTHLCNISETAAENAAAESVARDDDDMVVDVMPHKRSKRRHSDTTQDDDVELLSAETKNSSSVMDTSDKGSKLVTKHGRDSKMKKRVKKEQMTEVVETVTDDADRDCVARGSQERKKHKRLIDVNSQMTHVESIVENQSHQSGKKRLVNVVEGTVVEHCFSSPDHSETVDSDSPAKSLMTTAASTSPTAGHKKRSKLSTEINFASPAQAAGKDPSMMLELSEKTQSAAAGSGSTEVIKSPDTMTLEGGIATLDVDKSPSIQGTSSEHFFELVMEDDDDASKVISNSGARDSTQCKIPSTPTRRVSKRVAKSSSGACKASHLTVASDKTDVDSDLKKDCSTQLRSDPSVISESLMAKKSPTPMARHASDVDNLPSPSDGSSGVQLTAAATDVELQASSAVGCTESNVAVKFKPATSSSSHSPSHTKTLSASSPTTHSSATRTSAICSSPDVLKTVVSQFSGVHSPPALPVIPTADDSPTSSAAPVKKTMAHSRESIVSPVSSAHFIQADVGEDLPADINDHEDESCMDSSMSPELPVVGLLPAARRTGTAPKQTKVISRRTNQGVKSYCLRMRRTTGDDVNETSSGTSVPVPAKFLTPPLNKGCRSDIYEFYSDGHESPHKLRGRCVGGEGDAKCEAEAISSDSDASFVFPLPPQVTRSCTDLEFLKSYGKKVSDAKEVSPVSSKLRKRSNSKSDVEGESEKVSGIPDKPASGKSDTSKISDEPEKPLPSRLRRRSSESKSSVETGTDQVSSVPDEQLPMQRASKTKSSISADVVCKQSSAVLVRESSPVSSRLRKSSCSKSAADEEHLTSIDSVKVSTVGRKKSSHCPSSTKPTFSSSDLQHGSQTDCSQPEKSDSAAASPRRPGSICRVSDDTLFPTPFSRASDDQNTNSPKSSPVSSPGIATRSGDGQSKRASFRLVVNLQSPKSDRIRHLSSSTSSLEDDDLWRSPRSVRSIRRLSLPQQPCSPSTQPGSDCKLRPRPRRSQRLITKNKDIESSSASPAKTVKASVTTPTRKHRNSLSVTDRSPSKRLH